MSCFTKPSQKLLQTLGGTTLDLLRCGSLNFIILQVGQRLQHEAGSRTVEEAQHEETHN